MDTDGRIQLYDRILQFPELDILSAGCYGLAFLFLITVISKEIIKKANPAIVQSHHNDGG